MAFAIKAEARDPRAKTFVFDRQKTMYGGKRIAEGDTIFVLRGSNKRRSKRLPLTLTLA